MASFRGFTSDDFEHLRGSHWRNRNAIGGQLAATLRHQTGRAFRSWGVSRRLELHLAVEHAYRFDSAWHYAKLFIYTHSDLAMGFTIEPPGKDTPTRDQYQHWHQFQKRLQQNPAMRAALLSPMANHGLHLTNFYKQDTDGGVLQGIYAFRANRLHFWHPEVNRWSETRVDTLIHQIASIAPEHADHLHLYSQIPQKTAVEMGVLIMDPIMKIIRSVIPLYEMTIA